MLIAIWYNTGFLTQFFGDGVPGTDFDLVLIGDEPHQAKAVRSIIGKEFMH